MRYLRITCPDMNNGNGCRVTLWLPGCRHKCPECHNSWTAEYNQGKEFTNETYEYLLNILKRDEIQGLTLSGGDPLDQSNEVLAEIHKLLLKLKTNLPEKDIWIYTGYYKEELKNAWQKAILSISDVLVDGPYIKEKRDIMLPFRGSSNQRIWDLKTNKTISDESFRA